ncbi:hypothetical protein ACQKJG_22905 [Priestia megaterium]|uniref:hypothetical protein n=1 Tax=Priestia TaxID=2800373 RepID=UPI0021AEC846|nr:hypothetical protein [Priestia aryabhattai]
MTIITVDMGITGTITMITTGITMTIMNITKSLVHIDMGNQELHQGLQISLLVGAVMLLMM